MKLKKVKKSASHHCSLDWDQIYNCFSNVLQRTMNVYTLLLRLVHTKPVIGCWEHLWASVALIFLVCTASSSLSSLIWIRAVRELTLISCWSDKEAQPLKLATVQSTISPIWCVCSFLSLYIHFSVQSLIYTPMQVQNVCTSWQSVDVVAACVPLQLFCMNVCDAKRYNRGSPCHG